MEPLSAEQLKDLILPKKVRYFQYGTPGRGKLVQYPVREQHGPLRWYDNEMRCASKGCGSSTYCKLNDIPRCMMHALLKMNEMLDETATSRIS